MYKITFIFLFLSSAVLPISADNTKLLDISKVSKISKYLVFKKEHIGIEDLEVNYISLQVIPKTSFVSVEAHLTQLSTKRELTEEEIKLYKPPEIKPHLYNHYEVTGFIVTFTSKNPDDGLVTKGTTHVSNKKP